MFVQERIQDVETPFVVEPSAGVLAAGAASRFTLTFAPPEARDYHSVLHLILRDVPRPPVPVALPEEARGGGEEEGDVAELLLPPSGAEFISCVGIQALILDCMPHTLRPWTSQRSCIVARYAVRIDLGDGIHHVMRHKGRRNARSIWRFSKHVRSFSNVP